MSLRYQIITIFPDFFERFKERGLVSRALSEKIIEISEINLRDFAVSTQGTVDDTPYGGGSGMILRPEPAVNAINTAKKIDPNAKVILFTPRAKTFNQKKVKELLEEQRKKDSGFILLCCRYEGVDQRVIDKHVDLEISLGDYVLMGGEVPAMAFIESTCRLIPGVLGNENSIVEESFQNGILEYPQYTKPQEFEGQSVPEVLLSGHHEKINQWRAENSLLETAKKRPELLPRQDKLLSKSNFYVALMHFPVLNKEGKVITSSITSIDLHDISRSSMTYGATKFYALHPSETMRRLMEKICSHWMVGYGSGYNPNRKEAIEKLKIVPDFESIVLDIEMNTGKMPKIITTSAKDDQNCISYSDLRDIFYSDDSPYLLLLGTGWGLADEIMEKANYRLAPVYGHTPYNHLSVRAAAAIIFDRLFGC